MSIWICSVRRSLKILGIDPGTHRLGYGLIEADGAQLTVISYGCLEPPDYFAPADRLVWLFDELTKLVADRSPEAVAVEELYFLKNVTTGLRVAEARGIVLLVARQALLPLAEYKPNLIKSAVSGYGLAKKDQMGRMVQLLFKLPALPKPDDAADGLAVALCHAVCQSGRLAPYLSNA